MLSVKNNKTFDWAGMSLEDCLRGNALDAHYTLRIYEKLLDLITPQGSDKTMELLMVPLSETFAEVEFRGMEVSFDAIDDVGASIQSKIDAIREKLYSNRCVETEEEPLNIKSTGDMIEILYDPKRFGLYPPKVTGKNKPSTDKECLNSLISMIEEELESRG